LHPEFEWASASLDGLDIQRKFIVEIKCPGAKNHQLAVDGIVPAHYYAQIQHQLDCCDLDDAFYFSYDGNKGVMIEVRRDKGFIENMFDKERVFWDSIKAFIQ
jgi:predicted phage-related endonuclease